MPPKEPDEAGTDMLLAGEARGTAELDEHNRVLQRAALSSEEW